MEIRICVGSSCHLKGSQTIIELMKEAVDKNGIADKVTLAGSFCLGVCNRVGVTVAVDEDVHTGITVENFREFFSENILKKLNS